MAAQQATSTSRISYSRVRVHDCRCRSSCRPPKTLQRRHADCEKCKLLEVSARTGRALHFCTGYFRSFSLQSVVSREQDVGAVGVTGCTKNCKHSAAKGRSIPVSPVLSPPWSPATLNSSSSDSKPGKCNAMSSYEVHIYILQQGLYLQVLYTKRPQLTKLRNCPPSLPEHARWTGSESGPNLNRCLGTELGLQRR